MEKNYGQGSCIIYRFTEECMNVTAICADSKIALVGYYEFVAQHFQKVSKKLKYYNSALYFVLSIVQKNFMNTLSNDLPFLEELQKEKLSEKNFFLTLYFDPNFDMHLVCLRFVDDVENQNERNSK